MTVSTHTYTVTVPSFPFTIGDLKAQLAATGDTTIGGFNTRYGHMTIGQMKALTDAPLHLSGGSITLDAGSIPHVRATLTLGVPGKWGGSEWEPDAALMTALDPRTSPRISITAESDATGSRQVRQFNLGVRDRDVQHGRAEVTLNLASDEALLADYAPLADSLAPLGLAPSLRAVVNLILGTVLPGTELEPGPDFTLDTAEPDAFIWRAGQAAMDFLHPLVQVAGLRLVCDEQRRWTLRDADYAAPGALSIRHAVNMIEADDRISRDDDVWFDAAVTTYTWSDPDGIEVRRVDSFALPETPYQRVRSFERTTPYPGPGFSEYAVRRAQGRGREVTATAVADWRANAEQAALVVLSGAPLQTGKTQRVEFDLDTDRMTTTLRSTDTPPLAWAAGPGELTWDDVDPALTWDEMNNWSDA